MVEVDEYYLPDIIKEVIGRVSDYFSTRDQDPFNVHFDKGLYNQVGNDKFKSNSGFLTAWFVMGKDFVEVSPKGSSYSTDASCRVIIATSTDPNYSQQQREDINFHPRLLPVYRQFMTELINEPKLENSDSVDHARRILPYWGGGDVNAPSQPNLWKNNVDCIDIFNIQLKKGLKQCTPSSNF